VTRVPALFLAVGLAACSHTRAVESEPQAGHESPPYDANAAAAHRPAKTGEDLAKSHIQSENGVPLSTSPAGTLRPGAAKLIQDRLARAGALERDHVTGELDGPTRAALARFQAKHHLPATGDPDESTVKKLGLNVAEVFVSGH
jgi:hypothetical protein